MAPPTQPKSREQSSDEHRSRASISHEGAVVSSRPVFPDADEVAGRGPLSPALSSRGGVNTAVQGIHDTSTAPTGNNTQQYEVGESSNKTIVQPSSRSRNRGYSLRRSLFAQSLTSRNVGMDRDIEMDSPPLRVSQSSIPGSGEKRGGKNATTVTVSEAADEDEDKTPPTNLRCLSDSTQPLSSYQNWLSRRIPGLGILSRSLRSSRLLSGQLFQDKPLPSTADGRHVRVNCLRSFQTIDERTGESHIRNIIRSCRYTPLNFVPRQLAAQFGKLANFYFLCVSILQMIPGLSTTGTYTTIVPLLVFVGISMAKEGYDDIRRNRLDREENESETYVLDGARDAKDIPFHQHPEFAYPETGSTGWRKEKWQDVRVGDVVLVRRDTPIPADLVLLHAHDCNGTAFIETKSLDGETNLKSKVPLAELSQRCQDLDALAMLDAEFVVEDPNQDLYKLDGRVSVGGCILPLTNNEVVYRGSVLRNTMSAVGVVIYSGEECKIRMNANQTPRIKAPTLQAMVNKVVIFIAILVFFIAIIMTSAYQIWHRTTESQAWYLIFARVPFGQILTSFIIMFNTMLPLSLYVSLEIVKLCQIFLMNDVDMYDAEFDIPMEPHTSTINEELGQVSYIFSDKTGTLTNNSMRFRKISVGGTAWLHDADLQEEALNDLEHPRLRHKKRKCKGKLPAARRKDRSSASDLPRKSITLALDKPETAHNNVESLEWQPSSRQAGSLHCAKTEELLEYIARKPLSVFSCRAKFFILALALCHTCMPEKDDNDDVTFQAASPDELALVMAAQDLGYVVTDRQSKSIVVKTHPNGEDEEAVYETFEIMDVIEFSSARKRMSIVVKLPDQRLCIFTKGADTTIQSLLRLSDLAAACTSAVGRRASQRKSLEVQEVLRRKSVQVQTGFGNPRSSISIADGPAAIGRNSSISQASGHTARDSIDQWLKERETDIDMSVPRRSNSYYTSRTSAHLNSARVSGNAKNRPPQDSYLNGRSDIQPAEFESLVDESVALSDSATFERCFQHIDDFATEGLRTLLYAYRYVPEEEYDEWKNVYATACTSLVDRQEKIEAAGALIETRLELLGATAIEDKLQKGVPDAIDRLRRAGIKIWMLTGDKRETAINIGHSCRLIKDYSKVTILDHAQTDLKPCMKAALQQITNGATAHSVLVVDGQTLSQIDRDHTVQALFVDLAICADSVICCRASPSQKASLVKTIRHKVNGSVTLAIGDGANDIAMIQEAHLGIGIAGKEGLQAARTSDYSIAQFRFLLKLLLVHGRWNYIRVCKYTLGTFWKEMMFYMVQAMYQRWNGYTGTSLYEPWSLSMFNTLFTSLPVIFMGVFEKDLAASTLLAVPELYTLGQRNGGFNFKIYAEWAFLGACEAAVIYFTMYSIYGEALFTRDNRLYAMGSLAFTSCVTLISLKLQIIELHNKSVAALVAVGLSVGGWWLWNLAFSFIYGNNTIYSVKGGLIKGFGANPLWWLTLILIVLSVALLEITIKSIRAAVWPSDVDTFQKYEKDIEVRKRFEEAASELLQQGWDRGTKKSSLEMARDAGEQAEREAQVQQLLDRPRTMNPSSNSHPGSESLVRRRHSGPTDDGEVAVKLGKAGENVQPQNSVDVADLFSTGFGLVRKESDL